MPNPFNQGDFEDSARSRLIIPRRNLPVHYYNENDAKTAAWLRELIKEGFLPYGVVDERSIEDVNGSELAGYTQCHFFAGIGGWPYALKLAGWPDDLPVWTGSCPCQPFSIAGKHLGRSDERHLWPAFFKLIKQCKPFAVFGEQVENSINHGWLDDISSDLEAENYACGAVVLGAHSVGAPHKRQRLYWFAHPERSLRSSCERAWSRGTWGVGRVNQSVSWDGTWECALSKFRALDDGVSPASMEVCCGSRNAIVPQVAAQFIQAAVEAIQDTQKEILK